MTAVSSAEPRATSCVEVARVVLGELAAALLELVEAQQARVLVVPQAPRVVVDDVLELRALGADVEQLVHLLLVLDHREARLGVVDDELHLLLDGVLVERHRDAAERLGGQHRPVELRAVVADHRGLVAARKAERGQARAR